jgi:uncharacterized protein YjiS (DUF1127 family)
MGTLTHATPTHRQATTATKNGRLSEAHSLWRRWRQRARMRAELRSMDERALADIGLDLETARHEAHKFFWQV